MSPPKKPPRESYRSSSSYSSSSTILVEDLTPATRSQSSHQHSLLLSDEANTKLFSLLQPRTQALSTAFVAAVIAKPPKRPEWRPFRTGVAVLMKDYTRKAYYIQIYDIVEWESVREDPLVKGAAYQISLPKFHQYETEKGHTIGLKFASETEARSFAQVARAISMTGQYKTDGCPMPLSKEETTEKEDEPHQENRTEEEQEASLSPSPPAPENNATSLTPPLPPPPPIARDNSLSPIPPLPPVNKDPSQVPHRPPPPIARNSSLSPVPPLPPVNKDPSVSTPSPPPPPPVNIGTSPSNHSLSPTTVIQDILTPPTSPPLRPEDANSSFSPPLSPYSANTLNRKRQKSKKITKQMIGHPTNFQHLHHVGFNPNSPLDEKSLEAVVEEAVRRPVPARPPPPPPPLKRKNSGQSPPSHIPESVCISAEGQHTTSGNTTELESEEALYRNTNDTKTEQVIYGNPDETETEQAFNENPSEADAEQAIYENTSEAETGKAICENPNEAEHEEVLHVDPTETETEQVLYKNSNEIDEQTHTAETPENLLVPDLNVSSAVYENLEDSEDLVCGESFNSLDASNSSDDLHETSDSTLVLENEALDCSLTEVITSTPDNTLTDNDLAEHSNDLSNIDVPGQEYTETPNFPEDNFVIPNHTCDTLTVIQTPSTEDSGTSTETEILLAELQNSSIHSDANHSHPVTNTVSYSTTAPDTNSPFPNGNPEPGFAGVSSPEPVSGEVPSTEPVSGEMLSPEPVSGEMLSPEPVSGEMLSYEPVSGEVPSTEPVSGEMLSPEPVSGEVPSPELVSGEVPSPEPAVAPSDSKNSSQDPQQPDKGKSDLASTIFGQENLSENSNTLDMPKAPVRQRRKLSKRPKPPPPPPPPTPTETMPAPF